MSMTPALRKFMLTTHVTASVGWLGALAVFLAHTLVSLFSQDEQMVRAVSFAMGLTAWFVILPLGLASLLTGLVRALGTVWGLFRQYWVFFKLLLTTVVTGVLLLKLGPISHLADAASANGFSSTDLVGLRTSILVHAIGGLLVLLATLTLAVFKPAGMTRYEVRRSGLTRASATSTPLWANVSGVVAALLTLMLGVMLFGGGHGPGTHLG